MTSIIYRTKWLNPAAYNSFDRAHKIVQVNTFYDLYGIIIIEKFELKVVYKIYPGGLLSKHYGIYDYIIIFRKKIFNWYYIGIHPRLIFFWLYIFHVSFPVNDLIGVRIQHFLYRYWVDLYNFPVKNINPDSYKILYWKWNMSYERKKKSRKEKWKKVKIPFKTHIFCERKKI